MVCSWLPWTTANWMNTSYLSIWAGAVVLRSYWWAQNNRKISSGRGCIHKVHARSSHFFDFLTLIWYYSTTAKPTQPEMPHRRCRSFDPLLPALPRSIFCDNNSRTHTAHTCILAPQNQNWPPHRSQHWRMNEASESFVDNARMFVECEQCCSIAWPQWMEKPPTKTEQQTFGIIECFVYVYSLKLKCVP